MELLNVELEQDVELLTSYELSGGVIPSGTKEIDIDSAGTITEDVVHYENVQIDVPQGVAATPVFETITAPPTISISGRTITASVNASKNITPYIEEGWVSEGTANRVSAKGSATAEIPSEFIVPSGNKTIEIDEEGTTTEDITNYASVTVNLVAITDAEIDALN